jgi:hypothetical protein
VFLDHSLVVLRATVSPRSLFLKVNDKEEN